MSQDITFSSAGDLAASIKARRLSATEVLDAHLKQIEAHNPSLNAVVTLDAERARADAKLADAAIARGDSIGPLHGVPFTLKDAFATEGMRTTVGFQSFDHVPKANSTVAERLKSAGAIL